jgi:hypothetical protein
MSLLKFLFAFIAFIFLGNTGPVKAQPATAPVTETPHPKYKTSLPDSTKFPISKSDLATFCRALNISSLDSAESNTEKIWLGLTDPVKYDEEFKWARQMQLWEIFDSPFPACWAFNGE